MSIFFVLVIGIALALTGVEILIEKIFPILK